MIAAIYARVSSKDGRQFTENQLPDLRAFVERLGYTLYKEYVEQETGTGAVARAQFDQMFLDAHQRRFQVVVFWALDRFSREGPRETLNHLHRLREHGVEYISFTEQYLNSLGPWQQAIEGFLASIAKQESVRRGQRVRAGHERVKLTGTKSGKAIGRPALPVATVTRIQDLRAAGMSFRKIATELGVPVATVHLHCSDKKASSN